MSTTLRFKGEDTVQVHPIWSVQAVGWAWLFLHFRVDACCDWTEAWSPCPCCSL